MSKKQVQLYLVGKKLLASVTVLHITEGLCSLAPCFHSNTELECLEKSGVCCLSQNCHQLSQFFIFPCFPHLVFMLFVFQTVTHGASEMKSAPWEPFQLLCALVLLLCPFTRVCPQDPWGFQASCQRAGNCVLVTLAAFESRFPAPTPPEACQETGMNSAGSYELFHRRAQTKKLENIS